MSESKRKCEKMGQNLSSKKMSAIKRLNLRAKKERNLRVKKMSATKKAKNKWRR